MLALTPSERRGALVVVLLLGIGTAYDLCRSPATLPPAAAPTVQADTAEALGDSAATGTRVDLNRATASDLDALPGIGPVLAGRIVEHRTSHGPFGSVDELLAVRGIGPQLLERLRPLVGVSVPAPK